MPTLVEVRDRVDTWLQNRWSTVVGRQETYFGNHGKYWQGLITHNMPPEHTTDDYGDTPPDNLTARPSDVPLSWEDFFPEIKDIPAPVQLEMHMYSGPMGPGFVAILTVRYDGTLYRRIQQFGPESWRNHQWFRLVNPLE